MDEVYSTRRLLALRKLTRAIADSLRGTLKDYLSTLAPLFRPAAILGGFVEGGAKESAPGADKALAELQTLYQAIAGSKPYGLRKELKPPLELASTSLDLDLTPLEYAHAPMSGEGR